MPHPLPTLTEMISALIAAPSVSSTDPSLDQSNRPVIELLAGWLDDAGFTVEVLEVPGAGDKANLVATLGRGDGGLVLSGHTDTVPWDEGKWRFDPFTLTEADNRFYGLGTADMKAFLALAIEASRDLDAGKLNQPLILLATADEETSMSGAKALAARGMPGAPRHAIIGEPTGLRPVRLHKGIMMEALHLQGRSGHSSDPALGNSALEAMVTALAAIRDWREELQSKNHNTLFAVPVPTLNLGHIHGGDNPNRICAECELHMDLRPLPGMAIGELREELHARVQQALADTGIGISFTSLFDGIPAMETPADAAIVKLSEKLTGHAAGAAAFGTEGPFLNGLGMQTVILGPGDIDQAHQPDEYLAMDRIEPTVELLRQVIDGVCLATDRLI